MWRQFARRAPRRRGDDDGDSNSISRPSATPNPPHAAQRVVVVLSDMYCMAETFSFTPSPQTACRRQSALCSPLFRAVCNYTNESHKAHGRVYVGHSVFVFGVLLGSVARRRNICYIASARLSEPKGPPGHMCLLVCVCAISG